MTRLRKKLGLYNLRKELAKWVSKNLGDKYVEEALENYDNINKGVPIGGFVQTITFLDLIERVKAEM